VEHAALLAPIALGYSTDTRELDIQPHHDPCSVAVDCRFMPRVANAWKLHPKTTFKTKHDG